MYRSLVLESAYANGIGRGALPGLADESTTRHAVRRPDCRRQCGTWPALV